MARTPRDRFEAERETVAEIENDAVRSALFGFADALDPEVVYDSVPEVTHGRVTGRVTFSNGSAHNYLAQPRKCHERGFDLLGADVDTVNQFMEDLVTDPEKRRHGLVDHDGTVSRSTAAYWQAALRQFYRWAAEPGADGRPDVEVPFDAVDGSRRIWMFKPDRGSKTDDEDLPGQTELDAMREACLRSQNTRRDRAFLEVAAGTGQRVYAIVTLRIGDIHLGGTDEDPYPHVMLNPEIHNDGDKGAIDRAGGRLRPFVADPGPVRAWVANHPMGDPGVRAAHGAPERFEDCYVFVGDLKQARTDGSDHWSRGGARGMLDRRKADTAELPNVETVETAVNPHVWRGYAYTKSKELPLDESDRRRVFGWAPGSDEGERSYDHVQLGASAERFAEAWADAFGERGIEGVDEQVVGPILADLSAEQKDALIVELANNPDLIASVGDRVADALGPAD